MAQAIITHDNDTWNVLSTGACREGKVYAHLASTTRGKHQRNGFLPVQICDWIDQAVLLSAYIQAEEAQKVAAITEYYTDRANSGFAAKAQ